MTTAIEGIGLFSKRDAAKYLNVSERTLFDLTAPRGPLPCIKPTAWSVRYSRDDLDKFIASHREAK